MEIDKIFNGGVDSIADNIFGTVNNSVSEVREMQKKKVAENVQLVIQALKKIESDLREQFGNVSGSLEKRILSIKDGKDGINGRDGKPGRDGKDGKDGKDGRPGRDGLPGRPGADGRDGVGVLGARIDFDGSLIITLTNGNEINVGEVVTPDLAESIKVITNGGGTSQSVIDTLASLQAQISAISALGAVSYQGTWNAATNTPTITGGSGTKGYYYVVSVAGSTSIDSQTNWGVGDWIIFNGSTWQKVDGGSTGDFTNVSISGIANFGGQLASSVMFLNASKNVATDSSFSYDGVTQTLTSPKFNVSGGTANGVAYLNASNALTTGNKLTFDGTFLGIGTAAPNSLLDVSAVLPTISLTGSSSSSTPYGALNFNAQANTKWQLATNLSVGVGLEFNEGNATNTRMYLAPGGNLGVGTTSPGAKLDVNGQVRAAFASGFQVDDSGTMLGKLYYSGGLILDRAASTTLFLQQNGSTQVVLASSGNLGLGVTPNASWSSTSGPALQIGPYTSVFNNSFLGSSEIAYNTIRSGNDAYVYGSSSVAASRLQQRDGAFRFFTAAAGTAGAAITFTQAMTLDASGNLFVGKTSSSLGTAGIEAQAVGYFAVTRAERPLVLNRLTTDGELIELYRDSVSKATIGITSNSLTFGTNSTERARITSGGYFKASDSGGYFSSTGSYHELFTTAADRALRLTNSNASPFGINIYYNSAAPNGTGNAFVNCSDNAASRALIYSNGGIANYQANDVNLSDRREKTNFEPAGEYLSKICAIPVQTFNYIDQSEDDLGKTLGVVAQDVQAVAPELVMESDWGTEDNPKVRLSIYQTDLQYALMKCIQEQQVLIEQLTARVASLEGK